MKFTLTGKMFREINYLVIFGETKYIHVCTNACTVPVILWLTHFFDKNFVKVPSLLIKEVTKDEIFFR